ncbi:hypothetical protein [Anabaena sp. PCC 7108]|uniref:hypothetical protein n=1 Tax=Anabaena sp. PCC 7108 TaxID=163908 RepID=UPI00034CF229|nr:hypothetical protein [Anabaena sp. PCC 7108]
MFRGKITFNADFTGVQFESIEFAYPDSKVLLTTVKSARDEGVILTVEIINTDSVEEIFSKAQEVANHTTKILTFKFNTLFQNFRKVDENIVKEELQADGTTQTIIYADFGIGMGFNVYLDHCPTNQQLLEVKQLLEQKNHNGLTYYNLFYSALNFKDPLSKFMALYSVLLMLCNDDQIEVDNFVLSFEPNVSRNPRYKPKPKKNPKNSTIPDETLYTRLRNEVGHVRPGTKIEQTHKEMENNLNRLILIVKELIIRQS